MISHALFIFNEFGEKLAILSMLDVDIAANIIIIIVTVSILLRVIMRLVYSYI